MTMEPSSISNHPLFEPEKVANAIRILFEPGAVFELRALGVVMRNQRRNFKAISGFFNSIDTLLSELRRIERATGIYVTLNPVEPALLSRSINRINEDATTDFATKDGNIVRRRWLLIDCDPVRPKGISATEAELAKAKERAKELHAFLKTKGWGLPVSAFSGNGVHLLYRIDLPQADGGLLQRVLLALSQKFDDGIVEVDKAVHNPSRITKLYGTLACKGDHSPERPHRMSEIVGEVKELKVVTQAQLEEVAVLAAEDSKPTRPLLPTKPLLTHRTPTTWTASFDAPTFVAEFVARHGIQVVRTESKGGAVFHLLEYCPWSAEHGGADTPGDSAIIVQPDGQLGFKCFHSHCSSRHWKDFRLHFEPDFGQKRSAFSGTQSAISKFSPPVATGDPDSDELRASFFDISHRDGLKSSERYAEMAKATVDILHKRGRFFFHLDHKDFGTTMCFDSRRKLLSFISADDFKAWLSGFSGLNLSETAFDYMVSACKTEALAGETTGIVPASYWHGTPTAVYLSNGDGRAVKITAGKVETVDNGTDDVLFASGQTLKPWELTEPSDPFETCKLFKDIATTENGVQLFRLWAASIVTGQRCKPPIILTGPVRSGKTRLARGLFELLGIPPRIIALNDKGEEDFWTQLDSGGLVCFDNADTRMKWLPDALASASTDGSHEKRQLYTDGNIIRQQARAWVIVTSANPTFASDAGLADRLLVTRLERRSKDTAESSLSKEIAEHRNEGLSWLAHTLSKALADREPVLNNNLNQRHPDFAEFAVRLGRAMGQESQTVNALQSAEADKGKFNLENDEIGSALLELEGWQGTASELLEALTARDASMAGKWSAKRLGKRIAKLWPHLESVLQATQQVEGHSKKLVYQFSKCAGYAGFQNAFPEKSYITPSREDFGQNLSRKPANPASPLTSSLEGPASGDTAPDVTFLDDPDQEGRES